MTTPDSFDGHRVICESLGLTSSQELDGEGKPHGKYEYYFVVWGDVRKEYGEYEHGKLIWGRTKKETEFCFHNGKIYHRPYLYNKDLILNRKVVKGNLEGPVIKCSACDLDYFTNTSKKKRCLLVMPL
jgi:hypothetical protein